MSGTRSRSPCCPAAMSIRRYFLGSSLERFALGLRLSSGSPHEAADLSGTIAIRPNDRRAETVGLRYQRRIRNHDPLAIESDAITSFLAVPINVLDFDAVGKRAAQTLFAGELVEPGL